MVRLIAVLLVVSTAGVLLADAQCNAFCAAKQGTACHHSRSTGAPRCPHQQGLTHACLLTRLQTATRPLAAVAAIPPARLPAARPSRERPILTAITDPPSDPPSHTTLRI